MPDWVIAVDGPGSSGKGTVARRAAQALGYQYVDTGAMYRAVALVAQERGISVDDAEGLATIAQALLFRFTWDGDALRVFVDGRDVTQAIRSDLVGIGASAVARHGPVRSALLSLQRELAASGGIVMDGRDIGTVVLPEADLKVFLDADLDVRARRRHDELRRRGDEPSLAAVRTALAARDAQDSERAVAPLRVADDGVLLDTSNLTIDEAVQALLGLVRGIDSPSAKR